MNRVNASVQDVPTPEALGSLRENCVISLNPIHVGKMKSEQLSAHGGLWNAEFDVALARLIN
jgi:hypothetical protein